MAGVFPNTLTNIIIITKLSKISKQDRTSDQRNNKPVQTGDAQYTWAYKDGRGIQSACWDPSTRLIGVGVIVLLLRRLIPLELLHVPEHVSHDVGNRRNPEDRR